MVLGQGCGEMLHCMQGSWAAAVYITMVNRVGWVQSRKKEVVGAGNRVGIPMQLRCQSRPQCPGPQTLWGLQVPAQGAPGVLLHPPLGARP